MVAKKSIISKSMHYIVDNIKRMAFSSRGFPIILTLALLGILFVMFRMKSTELDYKILSLNKEIKRANVEKKEQGAKKAGMLSIEELRKLAKKHDLKEPAQEQIIVIP